MTEPNRVYHQVVDLQHFLLIDDVIGDVIIGKVSQSTPRLIAKRAECKDNNLWDTDRQSFHSKFIL